MILEAGYYDVPPAKIATVVTHLEMLAPPLRVPDPPGSWTLRRVARPEPNWFRDLYRRVGADWLWCVRLRMSDGELADIIRDERVEVHALAHEGSDEGLLELDFRCDGECEIGFFGVTAPLIGTGAGRFLMNRALVLAWRDGIRRVWLHTCSLDSPRALTFYQRAGFRPFRTEVEVMDDPRLDGTLPREVARHVPLIG